MEIAAWQWAIVGVAVVVIIAMVITKAMKGKGTPGQK